MKAVEDAGIGKEVTFKHKEEIFSREQRADQIYLLLTGSVMIYKQFEERTVVYPTNFVGTLCVVAICMLLG